MTSDVADICSALIRIDTSNFGDGSGAGERTAAELVAELLAEMGVESEYIESAPRRGNVVVRFPGEDPALPALLVHGHLDVVPAIAPDWKVPPFSGEIIDGYVWGRGAVDMKNMSAMMLGVVRGFMRERRRPRRDIVFAWLSDEEAGGRYGAQHLLAEHPGLFDGVDHAISEVGGFSYEVDPSLRLYMIESAQKGLAWLRLTTSGESGHGSMDAPDNAVTELAEAVTRLGRYDWPLRMTPTVHRFLEEVSDALGLPFDPDDPAPVLERLGPVARLVGATLRHVANPTMLAAGYKTNVVPGKALAEFDCRYLPGLEQDFLDTVDRLLAPSIRREYTNYDIALETSFDGPLVESMISALTAEDPTARAVPFCLSAGTDNRHFARHGIRGYGFVPLRLPPELDFPSLFHGVDERIPVESLDFGVRVLDRLLSDY